PKMFNLHNANGAAVNGSVVNGRGLHHRKLSLRQRVALAADVVVGERPFEPSQAQYCSLFGITPAALRAELKARGNGGSDKVERVLSNFAELLGEYKGLSETERALAKQAIAEFVRA